MNPGEIHGLHKQVVDDLKAQLAAAREDASNERTRAEAAEQEFRELNITIGNHPATSAWAKSGIRAVEVGMAAEAKLAAIRAHLPALKRLHAWVSSDNMGKWTYLEGGNFYDDVQEMTAIVADALEALEP